MNKKASLRNDNSSYRINTNRVKKGNEAERKLMTWKTPSKQ